MSLKDRIAQFEKGSAEKGPSPGPPPRPKPKPGGLAWKPRAPSPPPSPGQTDSSDGPANPSTGMSASDAKESIGQGGMSLKDRMAALRGQGFQVGGGGSSSPSPPPKPADKPKWKPPPTIARTPSIGDVENPASPGAEESTGDQPRSDDLDVQPDTAAEEPTGSAEDEERERRAAIAARMARLGGARVGMGVPTFGQKPAAKSQESLPTEDGL